MTSPSELIIQLREAMKGAPVWNEQLEALAQAATRSLLYTGTTTQEVIRELVAAGLSNRGARAILKEIDRGVRDSRKLRKIRIAGMKESNTMICYYAQRRREAWTTFLRETIVMALLPLGWAAYIIASNYDKNATYMRYDLIGPTGDLVAGDKLHAEGYLWAFILGVFGMLGLLGCVKGLVDKLMHLRTVA